MAFCHILQHRIDLRLNLVLSQNPMQLQSHHYSHSFEINSSSDTERAIASDCGFIRLSNPERALDSALCEQHESQEGFYC